VKPLPDLGAAIRDSLPSYEASPELQAWARNEARKAGGQGVLTDAPPLRSRPSAWRSSQLRIAAGLIFAAVLGWGAGSLRPIGRASSTDGITSELVDAHVRSLLPGHLLDVVSTDRHTVKPWFAGKTDLTPRVVDLASSGFPLLGGRLDYVAGHSAATLAYGRRLHTINLFVWRSGHEDVGDRALVSKGYSLLHWTEGGLSYWAVTDAAPSELAAFREAYTK
jgi:anti-sigma factor RsiW